MPPTLFIMHSFLDIESSLFFTTVSDVAMFKDVCYEINKKNPMTT
jgi:hypothetical protein